MWPNLQETVNLVAFTEEVLNGKFHFLFCTIYDSAKFMASSLSDLVNNVSIGIKIQIFML